MFALFTEAKIKEQKNNGQIYDEILSAYKNYVLKSVCICVYIKAIMT